MGTRARLSRHGSLTTTATAASGVDVCITAAAGTLAASNYTFTFTPGTLTVGKAALTVTATNLSKFMVRPICVDGHVTGL